MSDLIRKADMINALCDICTEDCEAISCDYHFFKNIPTVDAVEVVRCRECKYSRPDIISEDYRACWQRHTVVPNDGFCSYGKRKEVSECES